MQQLPRIVLGLFLGIALLGGCSGPGSAPDTKEAAEEASRVYHVQLQLTEDKDQAVTIQNRGLQWWTQQADAERPPLVDPSSERPVTITWKAPFYRVRLGPFATEQQAETVLQSARSAFPDAFVAPGWTQNP